MVKIVASSGQSVCVCLYVPESKMRNDVWFPHSVQLHSPCLCTWVRVYRHAKVYLHTLMLNLTLLYAFLHYVVYTNVFLYVYAFTV